jgi:hypothetical protein
VITKAFKMLDVEGDGELELNEIVKGLEKVKLDRSQYTNDLIK